MRKRQESLIIYSKGWFPLSSHIIFDRKERIVIYLRGIANGVPQMGVLRQIREKKGKGDSL